MKSQSLAFATDLAADEAPAKASSSLASVKNGLFLNKTLDPILFSIKSWEILFFRVSLVSSFFSDNKSIIIVVSCK